MWFLVSYLGIAGLILARRKSVTEALLWPVILAGMLLALVILALDLPPR